MKSSAGRVAICAACIGSMMYCGAAHAQNVVLRPTNIPGVSIIMPPPPSLDILHAAADTRARYAIPPAPDALLAPQAHARWESAVAIPLSKAAAAPTAPSNGAMSELKTLEIFYGRNFSSGSPIALTNGVTSTTSPNWSGTVVLNGKFGAAEAIIGEFVVPTAHAAFGACNGAATQVGLWPGIDGYGSADVLQAGVGISVACSGTTLSSRYWAWTEWYPAIPVQVTSPAVHPGDLIYIEVWSTSTTTGIAYFFNYSTEETARYSLTAPNGVSLKSESVEWVVERPGLSATNYTTLANYIDSAWPFGVAWNYTASQPTYYYQGMTPSVGTLLILTMTDNN